MPAMHRPLCFLELAKQTSNFIDGIPTPFMDVVTVTVVHGYQLVLTSIVGIDCDTRRSWRRP